MARREEALTKELEELKDERERMKKMPVIQADDCLILGAVKTKTDGSGVNIRLSEDWKSRGFQRRRENGEVVIRGYWKEGKGISVETFKKLSEEEKKEFLPIFEWERWLDEKTQVVIFENNIELRLLKLFDCFISRYRKALDNFVQLFDDGIFQYVSKGGDYRAYREGIRNRLKRWFFIRRYEWNLIIRDEDLGYMIYEDLKKVAKFKFDNTLYIQGWNKESPISVKYYSIDGRDEERGGLSGDVFKFELVFKKNFFKTKKYKVQDLGDQEKNFGILEDDLLDKVKKTFYNKLEGETQDILKAIYRVDNGQEAVRAMIRQETVNQTINERLRDIDQKIEKLESRIAKTEQRLEARIERLEDFVGINKEKH